MWAFIIPITLIQINFSVFRFYNCAKILKIREIRQLPKKSAKHFKIRQKYAKFDEYANHNTNIPNVFKIRQIRGFWRKIRQPGVKYAGRFPPGGRESLDCAISYQNVLSNFSCRLSCFLISGTVLTVWGSCSALLKARIKKRSISALVSLPDLHGVIT